MNWSYSVVVNVHRRWRPAPDARVVLARREAGIVPFWIGKGLPPYEVPRELAQRLIERMWPGQGLRLAFELPA